MSQTKYDDKMDAASKYLDDIFGPIGTMDSLTLEQLKDEEKDDDSEYEILHSEDFDNDDCCYVLSSYNVVLPDDFQI